jgi:predicted GIY-YIG superfamily endonuclease
MGTINLFGINWEKIRQSEDIPNKSGVYMCVLSGEDVDTILYIGVSIRLNERLKYHEIFKKYNTNGNSIYFLINTTCKDKNNMERFLIKKIKPSKNSPTIKMKSNGIFPDADLCKFSNKIYGQRDHFTPAEVETCNKALGTAFTIGEDFK